MRSDRFFIRAGLWSSAVLLVGCGGSGSGTTKPTTVAPNTAGQSAVTVKQFQFTPAEVTIKVGTTMAWTNEDDILHTVTSGATPGTADGKFDGPMDGRGKTFSHRFDQAGRFPYFCSRHNSMTGTVVVQ